MKIKKIFIFLLIIFVNVNAQRIYINSIPKCGTHLVLRLVELLTQRKSFNVGADVITSDKLPALNENSILHWHIWYSPKAAQVLQKNNFLGVFIYRDPRDKIVSAAHWVLKFPHLIKIYGFKEGTIPSVQEVITKLIPKIREEYDIYLGWRKAKNFCSIKFEHLVGPKGGGNTYRQLDAIKKVCVHLKIQPTPKLIKHCSTELFGKTATFREGKIGGWKKYFNHNHKQLFKKYTGRMLIELGYEKNNNW